MNRCMRACITFMMFAILLLPAGSLAADRGLTVTGIRYSTYTMFTRIVFEVEAAAPYVLTRTEDGRSIMLGAYEGPFVLKKPLPAIRDGVVAGMEAREAAGKNFAVIRLDAAAGEVKDFTLRGPDRIVLDIARSGAASLSVQPLPADRPIVVVLDPGHGGSDPGLPAGLGLEKAVDLEIAIKVKKILNKTGRVKVVLTREKDQSLSFDERAALANTAGASVFVSIHAAPVVETRVYIQDLIDDQSAADVHAYPHSGDFLGYEAESEQQDLTWGKQQATHAQQSGGLGRKILQQLGGNDREPIQASLAGLRAVDAAAVLVEVGVGQDRSRVAEDIAKGVEQYASENR